MVKQSSIGYTLVEVLVVLSIVAMMAAVAFWGMGAYRQQDVLMNAQQELVTNLRSLQNKVDNGADGESVKSLDLLPAGDTTTAYAVQMAGGNRQTITLPKGVVLSSYFVPGGSTYTGDMSICFVNRYLTSFSDATGNNKCGPSPSYCTSLSGNGYICNRQGISTAFSPAVFIIRLKLLSNGSTRDVAIEGSGFRVNRIYTCDQKDDYKCAP